MFCGALVVVERFEDQRIQIDHLAPICSDFDRLCKASGGKPGPLTARDAKTDERVPMSKGGTS